MPHMYSHYLIGQDVINELKIKFNTDENDAFIIGLQGPDPFLYAKALPGRKFSPDIGTLLHSQNIDKAFEAIWAYSREDAVLTAYYMGYACHYALDTEAHPYIYGAACRKDHARLECLMDLRFLRERGIKLEEVVPVHILPKNRQVSAHISKMWEKVMLRAYSRNETNPFAPSYGAMRFVNHFTKDRYGIKTKILYFFECILNKKYTASGKLFNCRDKSAIKPLNLERNTWSPSFDSAIKRSESYPELYALGLDKAVKLAKAIKAGEPEGILAITQNRSYNTNLDCMRPDSLYSDTCMFAEINKCISQKNNVK